MEAQRQQTVVEVWEDLKPGFSTRSSQPEEKARLAVSSPNSVAPH